MAVRALPATVPPTAQTRVAVLIGCLIVYATLLFAFDTLTTLPTQNVCAISASVGVLSVVVMGVTGSDRFWSVQTLYMLVSFIFNLGQVSVVALGINVLKPEAIMWTAWIYQPDAKTAAIMGSMALLMCSIGATFSVGIRKPALKELPQVTAKMGKLAFGMLTASILLWATYSFVRSGGDPHIFVTSYFKFKKATDSPFVNFFYWFIIVSLGLLMTCDHKYVKAGLIVFSLWGLDAFMLGNRGQVLIAACVGLAVAAKRGKLRLNMGVAILGVVFLLTAISVVRDLRQYGAANFTKSVQQASPTDSLVELGASLRPTKECIKFVRDEGPRYGATYWAPFERTFVYYLIPGYPRIDADNDMRLANVLISRRIGPIGFSTIAEAYLNFGFLGTQAILFLIGLLLGRMDTWRADIISLTIMISFLQPLLDHVRQSFVPFPIYTSCGFVLTLIVSTMVLNTRRSVQRQTAGEGHAPPNSS